MTCNSDLMSPLVAFPVSCLLKCLHPLTKGTKVEGATHWFAFACVKKLLDPGLVLHGNGRCWWSQQIESRKMGILNVLTWIMRIIYEKCRKHGEILKYNAIYMLKNKCNKGWSMVLFVKTFRKKHIDVLDASILCHLNITSNTQKLDAKHM
jgi:hypothetical protein